jgi:hypothetical protein
MAKRRAPVRLSLRASCDAPYPALNRSRVDAGMAGSPPPAEARSSLKARNSRVASRVPDYSLTFNLSLTALAEDAEWAAAWAWDDAVVSPLLSQSG